MAMSWFAASAIMFAEEFGGRPQRTFLVYENVYLVEARSSGSARRKAERLARAEEGDQAGTLQVDGKRASMRFAGIRKVTSVAPNMTTLGPQPVRKIVDGVEATYSVFLVKDRRALMALARGKSIDLKYME